MTFPWGSVVRDNRQAKILERSSGCAIVAGSSACRPGVPYSLTIPSLVWTRQ
jgi:hypothetical protein